MKHQRNGFTLLELMTVMSIAVFVMGLSAHWIHQSFFAADRMRQRSRHHQSLVDLAELLRETVHAGRTLAVEQETLIVTGPDEQPTRFEIRKDYIDYRKSNEPTDSFDRFRLAEDALAVWDSTELPTRISLVVYRVPGQLEQPGQGRTTMKNLSGYSVELIVRCETARWKKLGIHEVVQP